MKTVTLLFILLAFSFFSMATTSLKVQKPQQTWVYHQGAIDSAVLSITPKGAYFECGLYLTYSSKPYTTATDTFEIQQYFDMPEGAILHDSWLWVNNQIMQAQIIDRSIANIIYEGIVSRRKDPSILYKNSATQYELRIYPLVGNQTRKVKITYMLPAKRFVNSVQCALPLNILKSSSTVPSLQILSYTDSLHTSPKIAELTGNVFQPSIGNSFTTTFIDAASISNNSGLNYTLVSPLQNGIMTGKFETSPTDGYYQISLVPSQALGISIPKKLMLLLDYENGKSTTSASEMVATCRQMLHAYSSTSDSFNLICSQFSISPYSNVWMSCDSATIESVFNDVSANVTFPSYSNLAPLLSTGINFIKTNGHDGRIVLMSNSGYYNSGALANPLLTDIQNLMSPYTFPVNIIDYANVSTTSSYIGGGYYYGNEYLYGNLSAVTGGNFKSAFVSGTYYYYYTFRPFSEAATQLFETLEGNFTSFDVHPVSTGGFCYGKYNTAGFAAPNKTFTQIGKYSGSFPNQIEITGFLNSVPYSQTIAINNAYNGDELMRKMWVGKYIESLEASNPDNQTKLQIRDSSICNRVLSLYTAFLALEPSDTIKPCFDCVDETSATTGLGDLAQDSVWLVAMPNPFSIEVKIELRLSSALTKESSLQIYNIMGQVVNTLPLNAPTSGNLILSWSGQDSQGQSVSAGIYILVLTTPEGRHSLKLVKN